MTGKKTVTVALSMVMALSVAACGAKKDEASSSSSSPSASPAASAAAGAKKSDMTKKYTVTALDYRYGDPAPSDGPGLKQINEKFNIDYQVTQIVNTAFDEKVNVTFASGSIPDLLQFMGGDLNNRYKKFAKQGAFLPLDDYIKDYETLKNVPDYIWDSVRVNGKIYAIPAYTPKYQQTAVVRKDWLDALGLPVPKSYDDLKKVAIAFTKNDPDKNGKNDTYGFAMGTPINPPYAMGPYWDMGAWYHKDKDGNFIPGIIGQGRKDLVTMFADLYKEGAITSDMGVLNWAETNKEFYSGKAGIFIGTPRGMSQAYMDGLLKIQPNAQFVALDPFVAPDGGQGILAGSGIGGLTVLSGKLSSEPDKVRRILEMVDFGRKFYPADQQNQNNKDWDWYNGGNGVAYDIKDNKVVMRDNWASAGLSPSTYFVDNAAWAPKDTDVVYANQYQTKPLVDMVAGLEDMYKRIKLYANPTLGHESATEVTKGAELQTYVLNEQVKMIMGQRPLSDWDKLVQEYLDKGGAQIIKEYNEGITNKDAKTYFK